MIKTNIVSSLEKIFLDREIESYPILTEMTALKNERISFQLVYTADADGPDCSICGISVDGDLAKFADVRAVRNIPVEFPTYGFVNDDNYLSMKPGLYPDLLTPLNYGGRVTVIKNQLMSVWIVIDLRADFDKIDAGKHTVKVTLANGSGIVAENSVSIEIIDALIPKQTLIYTEWFHCDCLADYYGCEVWSEEHWKIIERFAKTAVSNGINTILTPIFTPPLDTAVGGERLTTQLLDVKLVGNDEYEFGFSKIDRWIDMCNRVGIEYFEISHLFTQWGAHNAPKVVADVDGKITKIFGWETDATSDKYVKFLHSALSAFIEHMKSLGADKRCFFHISDEPSYGVKESYKAAKESVADVLEGYTVIDALSDYEFYSEGLVKTPIPASDHITRFIEGGVKNLWTYYCCGQHTAVSNRFIAMPAWRTRSIGMQFFKYDIKGFLQWGYNFYNNMSSDSIINPYIDQGGEYQVPAGDAFSVYPGIGGRPLESTRIISFYEAVQDLGAMKLCADLCGKEKTVGEIERIFGGEIAFDRCAKDAKTVIAIREAVNSMIKSELQKR